MFAPIIVDENMINSRIPLEEMKGSGADEKGDLRVGKMTAKRGYYRCGEGRVANKTETENQDIFNHAPRNVARDSSSTDESIDSELEQIVPLIGKRLNQIDRDSQAIFRTDFFS